VPYEPPIIDESGLRIPLYTDIRDDLIRQAQIIFGEDIYLEPDSQDYQLIAEFSDKLDDAYKLAQMVFNNRGISTAIGSGVDVLLKINGLRRKEAGRSQCVVDCAGTPGTKVFNGIVRDISGYMWSLERFEISPEGTASVLATCQTPGAVFADVDSITKIMTQQNGWVSVTNRVNAMPGNPIESDAVAKARQAISTARPSRTILLGTSGGIAEIPDVLRSIVYENDTNVHGYYGVPIPGHSICAVVEGGRNEDIAEVIHTRKTPGCATYGDVTIAIESPSTALAPPPPIHFFRPIYVDPKVKVFITPRKGFVSDFVEEIRSKVVDYLNTLDIGVGLTTSALYVPAQAIMPNISAPVFSITDILIGMDDDSMSRDDMKIEYNEVTRGRVENVEIVLPN